MEPQLLKFSHRSFKTRVPKIFFGLFALKVGIHGSSFKATAWSCRKKDQMVDFLLQLIQLIVNNLNEILVKMTTYAFKFLRSFKSPGHDGSVTAALAESDS